MTDTMEEIAKLQKLVADYDEMVNRAVKILDGAPFFTSVGKDWDWELARLEIKGTEATLFWPEGHEGYYHSFSIEKQRKGFPSELLLMPKGAIAHWKAKEERAYDERQEVEKKHKAAVEAEIKEKTERETLRILKEKYGS